MTLGEYEMPEDVLAEMQAGPELVTCDNCPATSEAGWGDTPLCLDCQLVIDPSRVCEEHQRTFVDKTCPLEHDVDVVHLMTVDGCKISINGQGHLPCSEHPS